MPTVGEQVHYVAYGSPVRPDGTQQFASVCRAAIVTEVSLDASGSGRGYLVGLCVLNPTGIFFHPESVFDDSDAQVGGTWHELH